MTDDSVRRRARISRMARWIALLAVGGLAVGVAPARRPAPSGRIALTPRSFIPPIFGAATLLAQPPGPTTTGCTGTPITADPLLGGQNGELSITINSLSLLTATNVTATIFNTPKGLNFAKARGLVRDVHPERADQRRNLYQDVDRHERHP